VDDLPGGELDAVEHQVAVRVSGAGSTSA
jgi:hypothetical protein